MAKPSRYDKAEFEAREQKRQDVKNDSGNQNSVNDLRDRVLQLEQALGLKPL